MNLQLSLENSSDTSTSDTFIHRVRQYYSTNVNRYVHVFPFTNIDGILYYCGPTEIFETYDDNICVFVILQISNNFKYNVYKSIMFGLENHMSTHLALVDRNNSENDMKEYIIFKNEFATLKQRISTTQSNISNGTNIIEFFNLYDHPYVSPRFPKYIANVKVDIFDNNGRIVL